MANIYKPPSSIKNRDTPLTDLPIHSNSVKNANLFYGIRFYIQPYCSYHSKGKPKIPKQCDELIELVTSRGGKISYSPLDPSVTYIILYPTLSPNESIKNDIIPIKQYKDENKLPYEWLNKYGWATHSLILQFGEIINYDGIIMAQDEKWCNSQKVVLKKSWLFDCIEKDEILDDSVDWNGWRVRGRYRDAPIYHPPSHPQMPRSIINPNISPSTTHPTLLKPYAVSSTHNSCRRITANEIRSTYAPSTSDTPVRLPRLTWATRVESREIKGFDYLYLPITIDQINAEIPTSQDAIVEHGIASHQEHDTQINNIDRNTVFRYATNVGKKPDKQSSKAKARKVSFALDLVKEEEDAKVDQDNAHYSGDSDLDCLDSDWEDQEDVDNEESDKMSVMPSVQAQFIVPPVEHAWRSLKTLPSQLSILPIEPEVRDLQLPPTPISAIPKVLAESRAFPLPDVIDTPHENNDAEQSESRKSVNRLPSFKKRKLSPTIDDIPASLPTNNSGKETAKTKKRKPTGDEACRILARALLNKKEDQCKKDIYVLLESEYEGRVWNSWRSFYSKNEDEILKVQKRIQNASRND
ncbi:uncharacterized protein L201_006961 [Kwoniella dendrophila CBS 6074]|uniref:BRCT domain-containing protein n=1 Tax=Kwoniella dendrophila CBS 6074 TaxID=1295534 RepID=A0AAX4K575_9TREE